MLCRCRKHAASCVQQLATQLVSGISGCWSQRFFSVHTPYFAGWQIWQVLQSKVLVVVLSVFPPVPGISPTAGSGRLWSLWLAWARYDGVQPRWWLIWWSSGFNPVLIRGMILQTPTALMRHKSQFQEPVWIWSRSVSDMFWGFEERVFSKLRSLGISSLLITDYWLPHVPAACSAQARDMTPLWSWHQKKGSHRGLVKVQRCGMVWRHFGHHGHGQLRNPHPKWRFIAGITYKWIQMGDFPSGLPTGSYWMNFDELVVSLSLLTL